MQAQLTPLDGSKASAISFSINVGAPIETSPAFTPDGTLYTPSMDGKGFRPSTTARRRRRWTPPPSPAPGTGSFALKTRRTRWSLSWCRKGTTWRESFG